MRERHMNTKKTGAERTPSQKSPHGTQAKPFRTNGLIVSR